MHHTFATQLKTVISEYEAALSRSRHSDASDVITRSQVAAMRTRCTAAIERASGSNSTYYKNVIDAAKGRDHEWNRLANVIGVAKALLYDIENNHLQSFEELLHGEVFGDFLEMASHLVESDYKDAAAVLTGGTLEVHLRTLCHKHGIDASPDGRHISSDQLNAKLTKAGAYNKLDQKSITAWLDLRNKAAHGQYSDYTKEQVRLFVATVRDFITRYPA